jgi:RNA polymerase sigma factor (sigma-70 family)
MASAPFGTVLGHIRKLAGAPAARTMTGLQLVRRFAAERDEEAFGELMHRHGSLVLGVCRRILGHEQDAEDAFQAAFLVLARKAGSIRKGESVGSFLYGVAYRIAMKERARLFHRRKREQQIEPSMPPTDPVYEAAWRELQIVLDEGLHRLPEKYRVPFVLCCLEGKSKGEAARELGWKEGTVSSRLAHARKQLQELLARKGVSLSAALLAMGVAENAASACVPPMLAASSVRAAVRFASGLPAAKVQTANAARVAEALLRSMVALPWKVGTMLLVIVCLAAGGAGLVHQAEAAKQAPPKEPPAGVPTVAPKQAKEEDKVRTDRYGDPLPAGALARLGTIRFRQGFFTRQVAFSPDGKTIACAGAGRGLCLWDGATGKELRRFGKGTHIDSIAFSPDGKVLACAFNSANGGEPAFYETATGRKIADLPRNLNSLAYAPDGKTLAGVAAPGKSIHFFDAASGEKQAKELSSEKEDINRLSWSPDGKKLVWVGANGSVHLWGVNMGEEIAQWKGHEKYIYAVTFSPDGKSLATAGQDETIRLWDVATHKQQNVLGGKHQNVWAVLFSRDGRVLASGHGDGTIALWDAAQGKEIRRWHAHAFGVSSLDFSPDGKTLVSGAYWECGPRLWDVATGEELRPFAGHTAPVDHVTFSPDGKHLLSLGRDKKILDWELASGREKIHFRLPFHAARRTLDQYALSPRGDVVASWSYKDDAIHLWDVATGKELRTLGKFANRRSSFLGALEFSPDGRLLAFAGTADHVVHIWDTVVGVSRLQLKGLNSEVNCVTFSHDGKRLAAGSAPAGGNATIMLWDATSGTSLVRFSSVERVDMLVFSPDSKILASGSWSDRPLHLWDVATGRELRPLVGAPALYGLTFSPDGRWLAGAGADRDQKVHVWEVNTGLEARSFRGHNGGGVISLAFNPDGRSLASGGGDSSVLVWDLTGRMKNGRLQMVQWTEAQLEQRWKDLASNDGSRIVQAIWDLTASPDQAVPILRQRIKPVREADARRVAKLIGDLDSEDFETRTKAAAELEKIAVEAESMLRKKLAEKPSLEVRQRIRQVLEVPASPILLRALRAIQVLEYAGTAEAMECLRTLANGMAEARVTREAKAALKRSVK